MLLNNAPTATTTDTSPTYAVFPGLGRTAAGPHRRVLRAGKNGMAQMKPVWWMAGVCAGTAVIASSLVGGIEIWLGMLAPLAVVSASWMFMARTHRTRPEQLTSVMMA